MNIIVKIIRGESKWPGTTKRTRVTGYREGTHSMTTDHWSTRLAHVGRARISAAIDRGDIVIESGDAATDTTNDGGEK